MRASSVHHLMQILLLSAAISACAGVAPIVGETGRRGAIHRAQSELPFVWREASVLPGGLRVVRRTGVLRTIAVLEDGTARIAIRFLDHEIEMNGRATETAPLGAEIRFIAARGGGVAGSMSIIGEARNGEALVAALLPFAWPPVTEWPPPSDAPQTVALSVGGATGALSYSRRPGAPAGVSWVAMGGSVRFSRRTSSGSERTERAEIGALLARAGGMDSATRLAMGFPNRSDGAATEVEMVIGDGLPLPDPEEGGILSCAGEVRALRARLDEAPEPPFVLNRPIEDAMLTDDSEQGEGPGVLLDLREKDGAAPLNALFEGLLDVTSPREMAALSARLRERTQVVRDAMDITAHLTGLPEASGGLPNLPTYLLLDADAPATRALALGAAVRELQSEPRLVVRRPTTGPREGMLRGSLWPIAERLGDRATACPFVAGAVAELATRDVVASPAWVRAVVAGGIGTCGCNAIMADELAREALRWSDVNLQSWGWRSLEAQDVSDDATVGSIFGSGSETEIE